eukprot:TRINITY_DN4953_c0_g5_i1.p1 TRINITY_DN4953_c0_g5~~TRINITY_DN4953_c0_g5_i1.p1  ORF type:complete len:223 (+),score=58.48 TRINITY_DN4953_c0_g5_i1:81-671(+)
MQNDCFVCQKVYNLKERAQFACSKTDRCLCQKHSESCLDTNLADHSHSRLPTSNLIITTDKFHLHTASSPAWDKPISGNKYQTLVKLELDLEKEAGVKLTGNGHVILHTSGPALDVSFFVDGKICGLHGFDHTQGYHQLALTSGTAVSHHTTWTPASVFAAVRLPEGRHTFEVRARIRDSGNGCCNGWGLMAEVFY